MGYYHRDTLLGKIFNTNRARLGKTIAPSSIERNRYNPKKPLNYFINAERNAFSAILGGRGGNVYYTPPPGQSRNPYYKNQKKMWEKNNIKGFFEK